MRTKYPKDPIYTIHVLLTLPKPYDKYVHTGVLNFYTDNNILYIVEKQRKSQYSLDHIKQVLVKQHDYTKVT